MNKLTYTKIGNDTISIDLQNGYTVIATELFNHETKKYEVTLRIKDNTVDILDLIEKQEKVEFNANYKTINSAILKYVAILLSDGFFDYYIRRYDYMMKCFDRGHELFEQERMNKTNDNKE